MSTGISIPGSDSSKVSRWEARGRQYAREHKLTADIQIGYGTTLCAQGVDLWGEPSVVVATCHAAPGGTQVIAAARPQSGDERWYPVRIVDDDFFQYRGRRASYLALLTAVIARTVVDSASFVLSPGSEHYYRWLGMMLEVGDQPDA